MSEILTCGNCESRKRVGDNKQYLICSRTNRRLPENNLDKYIDSNCPLYKSDIQKANDPKFTLNFVIILVLVLLISLSVIYIFI